MDAITKDKLKAAILTVIDDRYNELNDEIDKLWIDISCEN